MSLGEILMGPTGNPQYYGLARGQGATDSRSTWAAEWFIDTWPGVIRVNCCPYVQRQREWIATLGQRYIERRNFRDRIVHWARITKYRLQSVFPCPLSWSISSRTSIKNQCRKEQLNEYINTSIGGTYCQPKEIERCSIRQIRFRWRQKFERTRSTPEPRPLFV